MPASPSQVRADLTVVTAAAISDAREVVAAAESPAEIRASLFAAVPLLVSDYGDASAALALDWYDEIREAANPATRFTPRPIVTVPQDEIAKSIAWSTQSLYDLERETDRLTQELLEQATRESMALLEPILQKDVAGGFWDTITENATDDPDAVGWQRFTRSGACKFCLMIAGRGSVFTESTARFAAHTNCHCVAAPSFDPDAPRASAIQYVASKRSRTPAERAAVRDYLNHNYPDAPG